MLKKRLETITSHQIQMFQYSPFFFFSFFTNHSMPTNNIGKKSNRFSCRDLVFALPANIAFFLCAHCYINNRITIGLSDCCYKMNEHFFFPTNAGNKYYFIRFIDNFIKKKSIRYIKRLIFYGFLIDMTGENRKW